VATTFRSVSMRRFPVASGSAISPESSIVTNPGGAPRGVTSQRPSPSALATNSGGEQAMNRAAVASRREISVRAAMPSVGSWRARSSAALVRASARRSSARAAP
jgi:hypothetical protein